jgi:hypothetical protein
LPRFAPLLAGVLLLANASLVHADPELCPGSQAAHCRAAASDAESLGRPLHTRSLGRADAPQPTPQQPYRARQAVAYPLARLGFFARSQGFSYTRATALSDVAGGAVLQLDEGLGLTAAYRMLGAGVGFDSVVLGAGDKAGLAAPFLGVVLDF